MNETESGVISRQGVLDLSHLTSADQLAGIRRIERVGTVIVPVSLAAAYATIPVTRVGNTIYVPDGARVRVHTGPLMVGGDGLGSAEDVLIVIGVLIVTSPVTGPVPRQISVVGLVLAPKGSESALGPALGGGVGSVSYYRYVEGQDTTVSTGQLKLTGASLANQGGGPDDVLVAAGQVMLTGPITEVGYAQVIVAGQLVAPASERAALEPKLRVQGQTLWYRGAEPRVITDDMVIGPDFFRLLDEPVSLVLLGDVTFQPGVTEAQLREKLADLVVLGDVTAPAELVSILQVLASDSLGSIRAGDGPAA
jgi:hypothetical protein